MIRLHLSLWKWLCQHGAPWIAGVACFSVPAHLLPLPTHSLLLIVSFRVPQKFAESVMLTAFQSRTGQKFPRTPLPVFEVVQELRRVRSFCSLNFSDNQWTSVLPHVLLNNHLQVYITRYSKRDAGAQSAPLGSARPQICISVGS
jgi:hypothetical protein